MLKTKVIVIAVLYTAALTVVSLININNIPTAGFSFEDKVYHFVAYLILGFLWTYAFSNDAMGKSIKVAFILALIYGIVIEVLQEKINPMRTYDTFDLIANCLGVIAGALVTKYLIKSKVKIKS